MGGIKGEARRNAAKDEVSRHKNVWRWESPLHDLEQNTSPASSST